MRITLVGFLLAIPVVLAAQATDSGRIYLPPPVERSYEPEVTVDRFTGSKTIWLELGRTPPGDGGRYQRYVLRRAVSRRRPRDYRT